MVGLNSLNKNTMNVMYICRICTFILRDPVQLLCGHRCCQSCVNEEKGIFIKCMQCNEKTLKDKIFSDRGFKNYMEKLNIICSLCAWNNTYSRYLDHLDKLHSNVICNFCNEKFNYHKIFCENMLIRCTLARYGCNEQFHQRDLLKHYLTEKHQSTICKVLLNLGLLGSQKEISADRFIENNASITNQKILDNLGDFSNNVQISIDHMQQIPFEVSTYKISIEDQNLPEESPPQEDDCIISYDGILSWKIDHISRLSDKQSFLTSPPFYTSPDGYKMCVRLYFNGDGIGRSTHLSIFLVLMRGEFDALLSWPFSFQVIICLYDLTNQQNHITKSFLSDTKSKSFQRPQAEMNIGNGISQFIPISLIQQENSPIVSDGSIYLKVMIRKDPIPVFILPHIMSIDHALPVYMQKNKIEETIAKYQSTIF